MEEECSTVKCLKALNQSMLAPPYVQLKADFAAIDAVFMDVSGSWLIDVVVGHSDGSPSERFVRTLTYISMSFLPSVTVTHTKKARSHNSKHQFEFVWCVRMEFDHNLSNMKKANVFIKEFNFASDFPKDKQKAINYLVKVRPSFQILTILKVSTYEPIKLAKLGR